MRNSRNATALLKSGFGSFLNLLYPARCPLCHKILKDRHALICSDCAGNLKPIAEPRCFKCGKPVSEEEEYCSDCQEHPGAFTQGRGIFFYDQQMKYSIMKYKYFGCREYGKFYGKAMYIYAGDAIRRWKPDVIVPVPLHWRKLRRRGFNQAEMLARELSKYTGISTDVTLVKKKKATKSQKKLNADQRRKNLQEAFQITGNPAGKCILLVDDVYTTGSTMDVISNALLENGATNIFFITVCIGSNR